MTAPRSADPGQAGRCTAVAATTPTPAGPSGPPDLHPVAVAIVNCMLGRIQG
jgi:hypothetical protein